MGNLKICPYSEPCFMKQMSPMGRLVCIALDDVNFKDGECHFRKVTPDGPNEWDLKRRKEQWKS